MRQVIGLARVPFLCFTSVAIMMLMLDANFCNLKMPQDRSRKTMQHFSLMPMVEAQEEATNNNGLRVELFECASISNATQREKLEKDINAWLEKNDDHRPVAIDISESPCDGALICLYYEPHAFRNTAKAFAYWTQCADMENAQTKNDFQSGINDWIARIYHNSATFKSMRIARLHTKNDCLLFITIIIQ